MWDGLFTLLSSSIVMALASFLAGSLPLSFTLSQSRSRLIQAIGTGVLVGTSLIVIIPEGIETLYAGGLSEPAHRQQREETSPVHGREPHAWVGVSLILGYILMYLIDQLPQHAGRHNHGTPKPLHISLSNLGLNRSSSSASDEQDSLAESQRPPQHSRGFATTLGLVIHAAADGIALGASSTNPNLGFIVFLAIMIHKAPAAFGLTSVLLKEGLTKKMARAHLVIFSLAAPVGALATWTIINLLGREWLEGDDGTKFATGVLLLFSGGTFLYVAMHTMQESGPAELEGSANGLADGNVYGEGYVRLPKANTRPGILDNLACVFGMLLPLLTQVGHTH